MSSGGAPSIPGTLAVSYDGETVTLASLTGPFGARVAEYKDGSVTGEDKKALVVDPEVLRSVLAGAPNGSPASVDGCDSGECLVSWSAQAGPGTAVVAVVGAAVRSMKLSGSAGHLLVDYSGEASPWPSRITVQDEKSGRSLTLRLVAIEPGGAAASANR